MVLGRSLPPGRWGAKHMFSSRKLIWVKSLGRLARLDGANVYRPAVNGNEQIKKSLPTQAHTRRSSTARTALTYAPLERRSSFENR